MKKAKVRNRIALRGFQLWGAPMFFLGAVASADAQPANTVQVKNLQSRLAKRSSVDLRKRVAAFFFSPPARFVFNAHQEKSYLDFLKKKKTRDAPKTRE